MSAYSVSASSLLPTPPTALLGRVDEVATIGALLMRDDVRVLTLAGPGGIGKTRLALHMAAEMRNVFADRVVFVSLGALTDPSLVVATIAQALGVPEIIEQPLLVCLRETMREPYLVLLDTMEHLLVATPDIAALLAVAPALKLLVTSRAPLRIAGEQVLPIQPLTLPDPAALSFSALMQVPSVELFVQRARAVRPDFQLTTANAATVAAICERLEGLPLAIELAAARVRLLSSSMLLLRLQHRLQLLTGGARDLPDRQQTLRNTIDWSYELLQPDEQILLARCAIFAGGWTLEAAEAVCPVGSRQSAVGSEGNNSLPTVLDGIAALVDHSLIQRLDGLDEEARFSLLDTIREYALERLTASGEAAALAERHSGYYLAVAEAAERVQAGPDQALWMHRLLSDVDNLRAALAWLRDQRAASAMVRLVAALGRFWEAHDYLSEGRDWIAVALTLPGVEKVPLAMRAQTLVAAGTLARHQGDYRVASEYYAVSLTLAEEVCDCSIQADAHAGLGDVAFRQGDYALARPHFAQSLAIAQRLVDQHRIVDAQNGLGRVVWAQGDLGEAVTLHASALATAREIAYAQGIAWALNASGEIARAQSDGARAVACFAESAASFRTAGDRAANVLAHQNLAFVLLAQNALRGAERHFREALAFWRNGGARHGIAICLIGLAGVAHANHQSERAARLLGAANTLIDITNTRLESSDRADYDRIVAAVKQELGARVFADATAVGRVSELDELFQDEQPNLTATPIARPVPGSLPSFPADLTAREVDALRLVAAGLTNAQIAQQLVISPLTVNVHLRSIYSKLGVHTRAAATRFAVEVGLV